ncbi:resolvase [Photobacterium phosphoreum]|jgi:DNA invertase Pin-like site-specific DNA recombinase|uniref:recombinase family protein n=1 Tax=Photobacterium phosphoreum TaxID=659 RepID=UPI0007F8B871|nr:recombinase family protein [Photobacterium phosphoreum]MCD9462459.1 resolvase [Photobacterium phosphoreum]OBU33715.1 resolvase [Photobacterium phosphoreum]OBU41843.1 resolvase [Photobacterium phosphoreum]PSU56077.1 resolvase [Photobacterium phosphoreum]PSU77889.1 resolvase [Photobacterium phosphoreum]
MRIYPYLRASTNEQDANRAIGFIERFANEHGIKLSKAFTENESGATLQRPQLFQLLDTAERGDVILLEQIDRLSRLTDNDWQKLKGIIHEKGIGIVSLDLPTSWTLLKPQASDDFTRSILNAVNGMLLDMLAAVARKDYEDRRRRQAEGIHRAKSNGLYRGRAEDTAKQERVAKLLDNGLSWREIIETIGCSRGLVAKVAKQNKGRS